MEQKNKTRWNERKGKGRAPRHAIDDQPLAHVSTVLNLLGWLAHCRRKHQQGEGGKGGGLKWMDR